jgi:hypothetical protein
MNVLLNPHCIHHCAGVARGFCDNQATQTNTYMVSVGADCVHHSVGVICGDVLHGVYDSVYAHHHPLLSLRPPPPDGHLQYVRLLHTAGTTSLIILLNNQLQN